MWYSCRHTPWGATHEYGVGLAAHYWHSKYADIDVHLYVCIYFDAQGMMQRNSSPSNDFCSLVIMRSLRKKKKQQGVKAAAHSVL